MKTKTKKVLALLLAFTLVMTCFAAGLTVFGDSNVAINAANFPDPVFRNLVADKYDTNDDGILSESERNVTLFSISGLVDPDEMAVENIQGIEFFPSIQILRVGGVGLTSLDVSALTNLTSLSCQGNELEELDIGYNMQLTTLNCADNNLTYLDLGSNARLTSVYCYANSITSLDFRGCTNITKLRCDQNELTSLDVSMLTKLTEFNCSKNHIPSLSLATTGLTEVTDYMIGNQTITLAANYNGDEIVIPFTNHGLTSSNYTGCSLDRFEGSGFEYDCFIAHDIDEIDNGIVYTVSTGIAGSEDMSVNVSVTRSFYQVKFYQNMQMRLVIGRAFVEPGGSAAALAPTPYEEDCKVFDSWSDNINAVNRDMTVFALYNDNHDFEITGFDGYDTVSVTCRTCHTPSIISFSSAIGTQANDPNYIAILDLNDDNYINAKDYALLMQQYS